MRGFHPAGEFFGADVPLTFAPLRPIGLPVWPDAG